MVLLASTQNHIDRVPTQDNQAITNHPCPGLQVWYLLCSNDHYDGT